MRIIFRGVSPILAYSERNKFSPEILDKGKVGKVEYYILNLGTHPCAYIGVSRRHKNYGKNEETLGLNVHGGLTYGAAGNDVPFSKHRYWYGWDYAHMGDFLGYRSQQAELLGTKKWKYSEILAHVLKAIEEIERI
jgi:hypothetical protein